MLNVPGKMRLFTAIDLSEEFKDRIIQYTQQLKKEEGIRFTSRKNLHITTFFIGEVEFHLMDDIIRVLTLVSEKNRPFTLEFDKVCLAPVKKPYMIWGRFENSPEFSNVCGTIRDRLWFCSGEKNTQHTFIPHVTIARFKAESDLDFGLAWSGISGFRSEINGIKLYHSILMPSGPVYKKMGEFKFGN